MVDRNGGLSVLQPLEYCHHLGVLELSLGPFPCLVLLQVVGHPTSGTCLLLAECLLDFLFGDFHGFITTRK